MYIMQNSSSFLLLNCNALSNLQASSALTQNVYQRYMKCPLSSHAWVIWHVVGQVLPSSFAAGYLYDRVQPCYLHTHVQEGTHRQNFFAP